MSDIGEYDLKDVFNTKDLESVVKQIIIKRKITTKSWDLLRWAMSPASNGLAGFLGDHIKVTLVLKFDKVTLETILFVKCIPITNKPKADYIDNANFYRREMIMFKLFEEIGGDVGSNPWRSTAYLCNERILVMPDLTLDGYITKDKTIPLDLHHVLLVTASVAKYHAAITNYETRSNANDHESAFFEDHKEVFKEPSFVDCLWLRAGAKLITEFLKEFSQNFQNIDVVCLSKALIDTCASLRAYKGTLNTVLHRDLWNNNIMFQYKDNEAVNAVLLDYQCINYGPPAFDVMSLLYLTTTSQFRKQNEQFIFKRYFDLFWSNLDNNSRSRMLRYGYDFGSFITWCERSRGFSTLLATMIFPYVMMEGEEAGRVFNNPQTFEEINDVSRTKPVVAHARLNPVYKERLLKSFEETVIQLLKINT